MLPQNLPVIPPSYLAPYSPPKLQLEPRPALRRAPQLRITNPKFRIASRLRRRANYEFRIPNCSRRLSGG